MAFNPPHPVLKALIIAWPFQSKSRKRVRKIRWQLQKGESQVVLKERFRECRACFDHLQGEESLVITPNQPYCSDCLRTNFIYATKNETAFPPRYAQTYGQSTGIEIPLEAVKPFLSEDELEDYEEKAKEWGTTIATRLYCSNPRCSRFLGGLAIASAEPVSAECPDCKHLTCSKCREDWHAEGPEFCEGLKDDPEVANLKKKFRWQRCPVCRRLVEKTEGCNSM